MFATSIQPDTVSLFSSTSSEPLSIFSVHTDPSLPTDSFIHLLHDSTSHPPPPPPAILITPPSLPGNDESDSNSLGYSLDQTVLHIQSPTLPTTYIRCPPQNDDRARSNSTDLGMKHSWMHVQVRSMGREWSFEVGLVDQAGKLGTVRCSTFQKQPRLKLFSNSSEPPLLHLPLSFPTPSSRPLTAWSSIALHLPSLLPHFSSYALIDHAGEEVTQSGPNFTASRNVSAVVPSVNYSHVAHVKVYATCRVRRIWFSDTGPGRKFPWEFELYSAD